MMRAAGFLAPRTRHCLVYMNHQPYGIYFLLEDVDQPEFMLHHFGHLDLDVIKRRTLAHPVLYGTSDEFDRTWADLARGGAHYGQIEAVDRAIDRGYFTRWIASTVYLDSGDNDQSLFVFNKRAPPPAWSLINWDFDGAFYYTFIGQTNTVRDAANVQGFLRQVFHALMRIPSTPGSI